MVYSRARVVVCLGVAALSASACVAPEPTREEPAATAVALAVTQTPCVAKGTSLDPMNRPETYDRLPPNKRAEVDRQNEIRNAYACGWTLSPRTPAPTRTPSPTQTPQTPGDPGTRWKAGEGTIIQSPCTVEADDRLDTATNKWLENLSLHTTRAVCAGSDAAGHPGVLVSRWGYGMRSDADWFPAPVGIGPAKVQGAIGEIVQLSTPAGTLLYFDANLKEYVSGFPSVAPTPRPGFPGGR